MMENKKAKFLYIGLAVFMFLVCLGLSISFIPPQQEDNITPQEVKEEATAEESETDAGIADTSAVNNVADLTAGMPTQYLRLTEDRGALVVEKDEHIVLDLNGCTISSTDKNEDAIWVKPGGVLFITGEGRVENSGGYALIFNEGECCISGSGVFVNDTGSYSVINHGRMEIVGDVRFSCLQTGSSLMQNGYYEYTSGDYRTGFVSGWAYPVMTIYSGDYSGGRISVKNDDAGICTIYGGYFHDAPIAALKNWGTMDVFGGEFHGGNHCIVLARRLKNGDRTLGLTRIHGGSFYRSEDGEKALFGISAGTDLDTFYTHGDTWIYGGAFYGFSKWYSILTSPHAVLEIDDSVLFDPVIEDFPRA